MRTRSAELFEQVGSDQRTSTLDDSQTDDPSVMISAYHASVTHRLFTTLTSTLDAIILVNSPVRYTLSLSSDRLLLSLSLSLCLSLTSITLAVMDAHLSPALSLLSLSTSSSPSKAERDARGSRHQVVIDYCLDRAASVFQQCVGDRSSSALAFLRNGDGENLLFILAQAETPPHTRVMRLLSVARQCCPQYNGSDLRSLTCRLVAAAEACSVSVNSAADWQKKKDDLDVAVQRARWREATALLVEWWVAATLRHDALQVATLQKMAAGYLDKLCHYVASASTLWQSSPKQAHLVIRQEERLYFVTHLFFVLSRWCRDAPLPEVAPKSRLRRWLAYMHEVYIIVMENEDSLAQHYALEIVLEIAMCLRFYWELYGDLLMQLTSQLVSTPLDDHGFVVMPNCNTHYHGPEYFRVADYHTHCLVAFFLTHSIATTAAFQQWGQ
jgi:hypothetical protein